MFINSIQQTNYHQLQLRRPKRPSMSKIAKGLKPVTSFGKDAAEDLPPTAVLAAILFEQINEQSQLAISHTADMMASITALPPGGQEALEKNAILNDPKLQNLIGEDTVDSIFTTETGYRVVTTASKVIDVLVQHHTRDHDLGPLPFTLVYVLPHIPVGELAEKWQFPSDHLPIGMSLDGLNYLSWNVLDAAYMSWVTKENSQGLNGSMITDEHIYLDNSRLTVRDVHVANMVLKALTEGPKTRDVITLQECSMPFTEELRRILPDHFAILKTRGEVILFVLEKSAFQKYGLTA